MKKFALCALAFVVLVACEPSQSSQEELQAVSEAETATPLTP